MFPIANTNYYFLIDDDSVFVGIVRCDQHGSGGISGGESGLRWEDCKEQLDMAALTLREPILFYDEVSFLDFKHSMKDDAMYFMFSS